MDPDDLQSLWRVLPQNILQNTSDIGSRARPRASAATIPPLRHTIGINNHGVVNLSPIVFWLHVAQECNSQDREKQFVVVVVGSPLRDRLNIGSAGDYSSCAL